MVVTVTEQERREAREHAPGCYFLRALDILLAYNITMLEATPDGPERRYYERMAAQVARYIRKQERQYRDEKHNASTLTIIEKEI